MRWSALGVLIFALDLVCLSPHHDPSSAIEYLTLVALVWCTVPYLTLVIGRSMSAALLSLGIALVIKSLGGVVVYVVYGSNASHRFDSLGRRYTDLPWSRPNLHVLVLWLFMAMACALFDHLWHRRVAASRSMPENA